VVGGRTTVDESALTGEPMPVTKSEGETVTAGTVNVDGALPCVILICCRRLCLPVAQSEVETVTMGTLNADGAPVYATRRLPAHCSSAYTGVSLEPSITSGALMQ
jgi:E1-E2 ATPase